MFLLVIYLKFSWAYFSNLELEGAPVEIQWDVPWSNCIDLLKNAEDIHGDDGMYIYIYNGIYHQLLKSETRWHTHIGGWSSIHVHRYLYHIPVCRDSYDGTDEHKPYTMFWPWPIHVCDLYHDWDHFRVKPSRTCFGKLELEFWLVNKNLDVVVQGVHRYIKRLTIRLMRYL